MKRVFPALLIFCSSCVLAHAQSLARHDRTHSQIIEDATADQVVGARAIFLLRRLDDNVIVYKSARDFEDSQKLARVSFESFQTHLLEITPELQKLVSSLPDTPLRADLIKSFASFRDGTDWWEKISGPQAVNVAEVKSGPCDSTSDASFVAGIPYIVAVQWRQANEYLQRAVKDLGF